MAAANDQFDPGAVVRVEDLPALPGDFAKEAANISPEVRDTLLTRALARSPTSCTRPAVSRG